MNLYSVNKNIKILNTIRNNKLMSKYEKILIDDAICLLAINREEDERNILSKLNKITIHNSYVNMLNEVYLSLNIN
jgi:hypothetical protein